MQCVLTSIMNDNDTQNASFVEINGNIIINASKNSTQ